MPYTYKQPGNWKTTRKRILARDGHTCTVTGCTTPALEVDHIVNVAAGGTHADDNLTSLCYTHHAAKTQLERAAGIARYHAARPHTRPAEQHPGRISPGA